MRGALLWFAAAILVALAAMILGLPFNGAAGFVLALFWLIGAWRLATTPRGAER